MTGTSAFYRDLAYAFVAALVGGLVARRLRQPLILGYVLAGILIGPFTPGPTVSEVHALELLAEVGVILLMYSIGMEFSIRDLLRVKWVAIIGGPIGIGLSIALSIEVGRLFGWTLAQGIAVGAVVSVASTMVLSRLLIERGELRSEQGRLMIAITLIEDLAVVLLTILLPASRGFSGSHLAAVALALGKSLLLLVPIVFAAAWLVPRLLARIARMENEELSLLAALALGFAVAAVSQALGLSLALGAFLAGIVVSGSEQAHETLARLLPIQDAFVALFFVTIGALVNPRSLISDAARGDPRARPRGQARDLPCGRAPVPIPMADRPPRGGRIDADRGVLVRPRARRARGRARAGGVLQRDAGGISPFDPLQRAPDAARRPLAVAEASWEVVRLRTHGRRAGKNEF